MRTQPGITELGNVAQIDVEGVVEGVVVSAAETIPNEPAAVSQAAAPIETPVAETPVDGGQRRDRVSNAAGHAAEFLLNVAGALTDPDGVEEGWRRREEPLSPQERKVLGRMLITFVTVAAALALGDKALNRTSLKTSRKRLPRA